MREILGYNGVISFVLALVAIVLSIVLHELAHGFVALMNGDATAKVNGRLTLNPLAHFDPIGFVMLVLVRFGYARPVPVNPNNFRRRKLGLFTVSVAGIALNLILAVISTPFYLLCVKFGAINRAARYLGVFFGWMVTININLALFNLLPVFPLDGYRAVESFTRANNPYNRFMRSYGQVVLIVLIGMSVIADLLNMPAYLDPLGSYISYVGGYIRTGLSWLWSFVI